MPRAVVHAVCDMSEAEQSIGKKPRHGTGPGWATIGWSEASHVDYAVAYHTAADRLVDAVMDERVSADTVVYPILYCYRHALELALKDANLRVEAAIRSRVASGALATGTELSPVQVETEVRGHFISDLTFRLRRRLSDLVELEVMPEPVLAVGTALGAFDADAQRLRYPELTKSRGQSFKPGADFRSINLVQLRGIMGWVMRFLVEELPRHLASDLDLREYLARGVRDAVRQQSLDDPDFEWDTSDSSLRPPLAAMRPWEADTDDFEEQQTFVLGPEDEF